MNIIYVSCDFIKQNVWFSSNWPEAGSGGSGGHFLFSELSPVIWQFLTSCFALGYNGIVPGPEKGEPVTSN